MAQKTAKKLGMSHGKMYVWEPCKLGRQKLEEEAQMELLRLSLDFDLRFLLVL